MITLILFIAFLLFLVGLTILKTNNLSPQVFNFLQHIPYHDKLGHFFLMGIFAYLALASISPSLNSRKIKHPQLIIASALSIIIILEESSQSLFPTRSCSWQDAAAGISGVVLAVLVYNYISTRHHKTMIV